MLARRLRKAWQRFAIGFLGRRTMRAFGKRVFGAAALLTVTAASYPHGFTDMYVNGTYPQDIRKREALKICQQQSMAFVSFLASDREECYREMRSVGMVSTFSGVWSKPDRKRMQVASAD
jgi:hypothetical protein